MAVVKNLMVRVGADFSGLIKGTKAGAAATSQWAKQTNKDFNKVVSSSRRIPQAASPMRTMTGRVGGLTGSLKALGGVLAGGAVLHGLVNFGRDALETASNLNEVQNVVDTVFPHLTAQVNSFATGAAEKYGLSETMAKRYVGTFGAMASSMGFTEKQAYAMANTLTGLSGDVASFYNIGQDEAFTKLKSIFTGETETLKSLGVVMTQANLDQFALANGYGRTTSAMSEGEKVALRYAFVQQQLANASGDFAKTSGSWANQVRLLHLNFENLKAVVGQGLIAAFLPFIRILNAGLSAVVRFGQGVSRVFSAVFGTKARVGGAAVEDVGSLTSGMNGLNVAQKGAAASAKALQRQLMGFDAINKLADNKSSGGSGGAGGGGGVAIGSMDIGQSVFDEAVGKTEKFSAGFEKLKKYLESLDFKPLKKSWENLKKAGEPLVKLIGDGMGWCLEHVLGPLGKWTMEEALPSYINMLASSFGFWANVARIAKPPLEWIWNNILAPLARATGDYFTNGLDALAVSFDILSGKGTDAKGIQTILEHIVNSIGGLAGTPDLFQRLMEAGTQAQQAITQGWENMTAVWADFKREASEWIHVKIALVKQGWASLKSWVGDKVSVGISLAKSGWTSLTHWVGNKISVGVSLFKKGWSSLSEFIGSITKKIGISIEWKRTGLNFLEAAISKHLFRGRGFPSGLKFAARGGIVKAASLLGNTIVGEAGTEAIVPLENHTEWLDRVADRLAAAVRPVAVGEPNQIPVVVQVVLDGRVVGQSAVTYINNQARTTGKNPLSPYL